ncbi:MAG: hypothetical protein JNM34_04600 [Chthonomonadaceae bacterium]|jgi:hypothetical protein|nr:hypothetical protein [Chthonomonadaceae bacterium]
MKSGFIGLSLFAILAGCGTGGTKHDLDLLRGKIHMGMSELEVTRDAGAPTHIDIDGDTRKLRYEAKVGNGYILVTLRQNVVIDVERKD